MLHISEAMQYCCCYQHGCHYYWRFQLVLHQMGSPEQHHSTMVEETKQEHETMSFCQLVTDPTRFWPGGKSDHKLNKTTVSLKNPVNTQPEGELERILTTISTKKGFQKLIGQNCIVSRILM